MEDKDICGCSFCDRMKFIDWFFEHSARKDKIDKSHYEHFLYEYDRWTQKKLLEERFPGRVNPPHAKKPQYNTTYPGDFKYEFGG